MTNKIRDKNVGSIEKISQTSDKNIANIENDANTLKELAKKLRETSKINRYISLGKKIKETNKYYIMSEAELIPTAEAIEEVLAEREQKDKQIQELEEEKTKLKLHCKELIKEKQELTTALLDSIPMKAVIDKIEELKRLRDRCITAEGYNIMNGEVIVLQELLEGERK